MSHWLPVTLIKDNVAELHTTDIITAMIPKEEFTEYYQTQVEKIKEETAEAAKFAKKTKKVSSEDAIDLIQETMEVIEAMKNRGNSKPH